MQVGHEAQASVCISLYYDTIRTLPQPSLRKDHCTATLVMLIVDQVLSRGRCRSQRSELVHMTSQSRLGRQLRHSKDFPTEFGV
jgi:hypothetical protein